MSPPLSPPMLVTSRHRSDRRSPPYCPRCSVQAGRRGDSCPRRLTAIWDAMIFAMLIRPRVAADLEDCERLAQVVHDVDGYPPYLPDGDLGRFILSSDALAAWVAELDDEIVGHVVLNPRSSETVMARASEMTRLEATSLAVVARLLVSPKARRKGVGRSLVMTAADAATNIGRCPILDVATRFAAAIALYAASGWICAGEVRVTFRDGTTLDEYVFIGPAGSSRGRRPLPRR